MQKAQKGDKVHVHYTGKTNDGNVFDSSRQRDPLEFRIGSGMVIPGFENAVIGLEIGQSVTAVIPANEGYGERMAELLFEVPKDQFPDDITPEIGLQLQLSNPDGGNTVVTITEITGQSVTLDANHFLAGKELTFDIELVAIV